MIAAIIRGRTLLCVPFLLLAGVTSSWAQVPVTTWHYDNARTGVNPKETILTPQNVNSAQFRAGNRGSGLLEQCNLYLWSRVADQGPRT